MNDFRPPRIDFGEGTQWVNLQLPPGYVCNEISVTSREWSVENEQHWSIEIETPNVRQSDYGQEYRESFREFGTSFVAVANAAISKAVVMCYDPIAMGC